MSVRRSGWIKLIPAGMQFKKDVANLAPCREEDFEMRLNYTVKAMRCQ